ncbi:ABC transporter permease [uncultured Paludibaculum sp.]|uniref:ABC transporter permease n=1 Tax=uncultured Paludibaculum sp. TaxID=1765020 RepID=UPI002AABB308|nr:ABC transporter permease [uncultured Paludibaculum sp.]
MRRLRLLFLTPAVSILLLLFAVPLCILLVYACLTRGAYGGTAQPFTAENWLRLFDPLYLAIVGRSFLVAAVSTTVCLLLGFPLALFISRSGPRKNLYLALVMLPFWTSFLVRTYAWMFLLRDTGLINTGLQALGLIKEPLPMLYNWWAVILGLVYGYLPFMVLPLFSTLERLDPGLVEAAADLGARPMQGLLRVILPLTAPGIRAGAILVFIPCLGAYLTPDLLGGGRTILVGTLIQNQFSNARDWPFGSAVSIALMALVMVVLWLQIRRKGEPLL